MGLLTSMLFAGQDLMIAEDAKELLNQNFLTPLRDWWGDVFLLINLKKQFMSKTISSIGKEKINDSELGICKIVNANGETIATFEGELIEETCHFYVVKEKKLYDIVLNENGELVLQEHHGEFDLS